MLRYKDLKLEAGTIAVDQKTEVLEAFGIPDTAGTGRLIQQPLMYQGEQKYEGSLLRYDFNTQQGSVSMGFSEAGVGYYFGDKIKRLIRRCSLSATEFTQPRKTVKIPSIISSRLK